MAGLLALLVLGMLLGQDCKLVQFPKQYLPSKPFNIASTTKPSIRTLLIDNYDSYTYNIWQSLARVNGIEPIVVYNDCYADWDTLLQNTDHFDNIIIGPGPGSPLNHKDFGISADAILKAQVPILGVCLGHQGIAHIFGGEIKKAPEPMHGRLSHIIHSGEDIFEDIAQNTSVVRYHSLIVDNLPHELTPIAWTPDKIVMGLKHKLLPIYGVQFHPESVSTVCGDQIFKNFNKITKHYHKEKNNEKLNDIIHNLADLTETVTASPVHSIAKKQLKTTYVTKVKVNASTESIFDLMYGNNMASFWLDSSDNNFNNNTKMSNGMSSHTSNRFSFMGALDVDDEASYAIEYLGQNNLVCRWTNGSTKSLNKNIFEYIDHLLAAETDNFTNVVSADPGIGTVENLPFGLNTSAIFGFLGYELRHEATHILTTSNSKVAGMKSRYNYSSTHQDSFCGSRYASNIRHPLALYLLPTSYIVYDHQECEAYVVGTCSDATLNGNQQLSVAKSKVQGIATRIGALGNVKSSNSRDSVSGDISDVVLTSIRNKEAYSQNIQDCLENIVNGETYEVCLTLQFQGTIDRTRVNPLHVYKSLRRRNASPLSSFIRYDPGAFTNYEVNKDSLLPWYKTGGLTLCCSSPERYLSLDSSRCLESKPIKGTARRNVHNNQEDVIIGNKLVNDEKSRAENLLIVDLGNRHYLYTRINIASSHNFFISA